MTDYSTITVLDLSNKGLYKLPDLSIYPNLQTLDCSNNKLTSLDNLPIGLQELNCSNNPFNYNFELTLENIRKYNLENHK